MSYVQSVSKSSGLPFALTAEAIVDGTKRQKWLPSISDDCRQKGGRINDDRNVALISI
jgi:hypothetical protein